MSKGRVEAMRVVFAGTPEAAVPSLRALLDSAHEVAAVVTRPDARRGRGRKAAQSPVRQLAEEAGVEVLTPARPAEAQFVDRLRELEPDAAPVVAYGGLIPPEVLAVPRLGWVNLHFSLLPAWRGAAPVQHALMAGDDVTGASTFLLEEGLDTGPVFGTMTEAVSRTDTAGDLLTRLAEGGASLLVKTLDAMEAGEITPAPQPGEGVSTAPKIRVDDVEIDWSAPAFAVDRRIRGASPAPGAWTTFRGERLKVLRSVLVPASADAPRLEPGRVGATKTQAFAGAAGGVVELIEVQPQGKKAMRGADWARGVRLDEGETFGE